MPLPSISEIKLVSDLEVFCYNNSMQNNNDHNMPDSLDFVPDQKINSTLEDTSSTTPVAPVQKIPKKGKSVINVLTTILTTILLIPIIVVGLITAGLIGLSVSHGAELSKLEKETTNIFESSNFANISYDCHDVELRNTCYIKLSADDISVESFLLSKGFSKDSTYYGKGYKKGDLYVENDSGLYSSYFVK